MAEPNIIDVKPGTVAVIRSRIPVDAVRDFYDQAFREVAQSLSRQGVEPVGPAVAIYWGVPSDTMELACGFPTEATIKPDGHVIALDLPGGRAVEVVHEGGYDSLGNTYRLMADWSERHGLDLGPMMWELYETEPTPEADPASMRTRITWPLAAEE